MLSKALLWREWRNSRALLAIFLVLILWSYPISYALGDWGAVDRIEDPAGAPFLLLLPFALGLITLGREHRKNRHLWLLAMPFSRFQIILNKIVFCLGAMTVIYFLNYLALVTVWTLKSSIFHQGLIIWINQLLLIQVTVSVLVFAIALLSTTIAGTYLPSGVLTLGLLWGPPTLASLLVLNIPNLPIWIYNLFYLAPLYYIEDRLATTYWPILLGVAALLLAASCLLYRRLPMENTGELLFYPRLYPCLKVIAAILLGLTAGAIFPALPVKLPATLIGGALGWFLIAWLIRKKRTSLQG